MENLVDMLCESKVDMNSIKKAIKIWNPHIDSNLLEDAISVFMHWYHLEGSFDEYIDNLEDDLLDMVDAADINDEWAVATLAIHPYVVDDVEDYADREQKLLNQVIKKYKLK